MDHEQLRRTYSDLNDRFCAYEKSVLTNQCGCTQAKRFCIAERVGVRCQSETSQQRCVQLLELLKTQARFALKAMEQQRTMPHGKAMKIQVGGMRGIKQTLEPDQPAPDIIDDVDGTILSVIERYGSLEQLPMQTVIQNIAAYKVKKRSRRNKDKS